MTAGGRRMPEWRDRGQAHTCYLSRQLPTGLPACVAVSLHLGPPTPTCVAVSLHLGPPTSTWPHQAEGH